MKAIILAAGRGRRLGDSVTEHPKCLLEIGGRTLLDRMLASLSAAGVEEVTVVIGHLGEQIEAAVAGRPGVRTRLNPDFQKGAILSLWTAREELDGPVLVMDADVLFPDEMLRRLVDSPHGNCFLMDTRSADDGEAMMLMARDGRVWDITRGLRGDWDTRGESVGFLKLDADGARALRRLLEEAIARGEDGGEHEELYPALMRECVIGFETADDFPWLEIDFPEDVERARELVAGEGQRS
ncbi:MAG: NTP transferase domain-containing protein [Armatimonadota bacterium]